MSRNDDNESVITILILLVAYRKNTGTMLMFYDEQNGVERRTLSRVVFDLI